MNLSKFFIDRPIFAGVLSILIFVAGLIGIARAADLRVSGGGAAVGRSCARSIPAPTRPSSPRPSPRRSRRQINGVEDMLYMSSQATTDGVLTLTVTFKLGTDPDKAQQLVQNRVSQAEPRLPEEVRSARRHHGRRARRTSSWSSTSISPNDRYDITYLRNYGVLNVKDRLARIAGVGQVQVFGAGDYSMRVWLDPQKVAERGLSASDVVNAIRAQNVQAAAGIVGASPTLPGVDLQLSVNAQGRLRKRGGVRRHHRQDRRRTARSRACATSPASSSAPPTTRCARCSTTSRPSASASSRRPAPTPSRSPTMCARRWTSSSRPCPRASTTRSSTTRRSSCAPRSRRWCTRCSRPWRWSCSS